MTDNTNPNSVAAGGSTTYTIVVTNNGPTAVVGAAVNDQLPALISSDVWTAIASPDANVDTKSGKGSIVGDDVNLPVNATVTFTIVAQISPGADALYLVNTASVGTTVTTPGGVTDSNTANNTVTDTESISSAFSPVLKMNFLGTGEYSRIHWRAASLQGQSEKSKKLVRSGPIAVTTVRAQCGYRPKHGKLCRVPAPEAEAEECPGQIRDLQRRQFQHHAYGCRIQDHRGGLCLSRGRDRTQWRFRRGRQD